MALNDDLQDASIRHAVGVQRLSAGEVNEMLVFLTKIEDRVTARLQRADMTTMNKARLERLLAGIREIMKSGYTKMNAGIAKSLRDLSSYEAGFQANMFRRLSIIDLEMVVPADAQLWAAVRARPFEGKILSEWGKSLSVSAFDRVQGEIRMGFAEGRTTDQIVREIRGTARLGFKDGIYETNRRNASTIVRTATNHTATIAREVMYAENSDVIKGVKWVSTLDGRTSAVCRGRDGQVYPPSEGPRPPAHWNCRSVTSPVVKSWKEMGIDLKEAPEGTRASLNGQVPEKETYNSWFSKQSKEFQDETLGPTRAKLFRDGDLAMDRFTDKAGNQYNLAELRRIETEAFEKAF